MKSEVREVQTEWRAVVNSQRLETVVGKNAQKKNL